MSKKDDVANALYEINERVLCFHGPLVYEAKVLKVQFREKEIQYWVHYAGWSKSWDEWVPERRVLKYSDENLKKQQELKKALSDTKGKKGTPKTATNINKKRSIGGDSSSGNLSATDSRSSTPVLDAKGPKIKTENVKADEDTPKRRKRNEFVEPEEIFDAKQEVKIEIPDQLQSILVDDWDFICRQKRLANLPAKNTINSILEDYYEHVKENNEDEHQAKELILGLKEYFNAMCTNQLLYRYERQQYLDLEAEKKEAGTTVELTKIYGGSHFLRLFTKLGGCLTYTNMDVDAVEIVVKCLSGVLNFLAKNHQKYFNSTDDYNSATPDYQRKVPA